MAPRLGSPPHGSGRLCCLRIRRHSARDRSWSNLPAPLTFNGVRADAWGQRPRGDLIAFGEAKTADEVDTLHTREQLTMLGHTRMKSAAVPCPVYIAIPRSAAYYLDRVLIDVGLIRAENIIRLHVPDVLIEEYAHGSRQGYRVQLDYQKEGTKFLRKNERAGLFDEQGLGKTKQLIDAVSAEIGAGSIKGAVIVCPNGLKSTWATECRNSRIFSTPCSAPVVLQGVVLSPQ